MYMLVRNPSLLAPFRLSSSSVSEGVMLASVMILIILRGQWGLPAGGLPSVPSWPLGHEGRHRAIPAARMVHWWPHATTSTFWLSQPATCSPETAQQRQKQQSSDTGTESNDQWLVVVDPRLDFSRRGRA